MRGASQTISDSSETEMKEKEKEKERKEGEKEEEKEKVASGSVLSSMATKSPTTAGKRESGASQSGSEGVSSFLSGLFNRAWELGKERFQQSEDPTIRALNNSYGTFCPRVPRLRERLNVALKCPGRSQRSM